MMAKLRRERAEALVKLATLTAIGPVEVTQDRRGFEVSVFPVGEAEQHAHYGGATLVEAIDVAYRAETETDCARPDNATDKRSEG